MAMTTQDFVGKKKHVLCPVQVGEKTRWQKMGVGFVNKDLSINVILDGVPLNGKLHIRDWEDEETYLRKKNERMQARGEGGPSSSAGMTEELPF